MYTQQCTLCAVSVPLGKTHTCELMTLTDALALLLAQPEATTALEYAWRLRVRVALMKAMARLGASGMARRVESLAGLITLAVLVCEGEKI